MLGPDREPQNTRGRRARALVALARARISNVWVRLAGCALVALVATAVVGNSMPLIWYGGLIIVMLTERAVYQWLIIQCGKTEAPPRLWIVVAWTVLQSSYTSSIAIMLWFAPYVHGYTLAVIFLVATLSNVAATLRNSTTLALAAVTPTTAILLALPIASYLLGGARNPFDLAPLVAGVLFTGFGINLWQSLRESDAAQARAEQSALRERQSAAAAAVAKSEAIRRMQDELRTPMTALIGAAEHLRRAAVSPEARQHIGSLAQAGEVLRLVLEDLTDLDNLENGQVRIRPGNCDPRDLARSVAGAFRVAAQDKQLELFLDVSPDVPALVELDGPRVRQILFNLVANAVKFTTHGGVRIRLQARATDDPRRVRLGFAVADTGAGMSRSQIALIFARGKAGAENVGQGLGLAISLRLSNLMGGKLAAKSELGQGSVFSFVIEAPIVVAKQTSAA